MKKYYVLDGSAYMYRCFYALPDMRDGDNNPCNALYGMLKMVANLLTERPDFFLIAWDAPRKTLRHEAFAEYKGTRSATPDDLKHQFGRVRDLFSALGLPHHEHGGYEADDIIATLARSKADNIMMRIYTSDKDLWQLVSDTVNIVDPRTWLTMTPYAFGEKRWFAPESMSDYLALIWDASDNIPGVMGIGAKWATKLIKEYQTLDNIYAHIEDISWATKDKLIAGKESAFMSKDLIVLMDVPWINAADDTPDASWTFDSDVWKETVDRYGFPSLARDIEALREVYEMPTQESLF